MAPKIVNIIHGDCVEAMARMPEASVDAIVTDPPYGLEFMGKEWDKFPLRDRGARLTGNGASRSALLAFQGFSMAWATEAFRVLKPGGHLLAFGGSRTYHRLACAIEDAGFDIRDCLMWLYGQGFPKSKNIGNGWGTALKPAHEPIILARKPLAEKNVAANVLKHGTGAINVDGCRIDAGDGRPARESDPRPEANGAVYAGRQQPGSGFDGGSRAVGTTMQGRWPANVLLDEEAARLLDEQSGELTTGGGQRNAPKAAGTFGAYRGDEASREFASNTGGASRFFYCAKTSKRERGVGNTHPTVKPVAVMRYLIRLVTPPGGVVLDPFMGSGTTGLAAAGEKCEFIGIEKDEAYFQIAHKRITGVAPSQREPVVFHGRSAQPIHHDGAAPVTHPWHCLLSTCGGRVRIVSTEGARVEGKWRVPGCACDCGRAYVATKHGLYLVRST